MKHKFEVGQKLWFVPSKGRNHPQCEEFITKVGRKWLELGLHSRADIETLVVDGGEYSSPGRCYLSKEVYEAGLAIEMAWQQFCHDLYNERFKAPEGVTVESLKALQFGLLGK